MTQTDRIAVVERRVREFVSARDWMQFHDPKNLAMAIASEAGELIAELRWVSNADVDEFVRDPTIRARLQQEVGDVGISLLLFCDKLGIDLVDAIERKVAMNETNYPIGNSRGRAERPGTSVG